MLLKLYFRFEFQIATNITWKAVKSALYELVNSIF